MVAAREINGMRQMATIGTFTSTGFNGVIKTLNLERVENPSDKGPQFRIFSGSVDYA
jgi:uncharacterized protein (DUF736 family)